MNRPNDEFRNIMQSGFYRKRQFTALNTVYLILGVLGFVFFVYAGWYMDHAELPGAKPGASATTEIMSYRRLFLLFICLLEIALGVYAALAANKLALFLQCLSLMLLLAAHVLLVYAFFNTGNDGFVLVRSAVYTVLIAVAMHLVVLAGRLPFDIKIVRRVE